MTIPIRHIRICREESAMRMTVPSRVTTRPTRSVTWRVWPKAWECQLVRAPG
jgi:hypothetical protein